MSVFQRECHFLLSGWTIPVCWLLTPLPLPPSLRPLREQYMRVGEGFLLVYSITSRNSFEQISTLHQKILETRGQNSFPAVVVANKCHLEYERQVGIYGEFAS